MIQGLFQSTPPRRRRQQVQVGLKRIFSISIHASAKEATVQNVTKWAASMNFNPRLREGGDSKSKYFTNDRVYFNPRLREGGDAGNIPKTFMFDDFNPRLREGGDLLIILPVILLSFQSTPPRRRRQVLIIKRLLTNYFNPRLREGGDRNIL